jgi:hypothetical protein
MFNPAKHFLKAFDFFLLKFISFVLRRLLHIVRKKMGDKEDFVELPEEKELPDEDNPHLLQDKKEELLKTIERYQKSFPEFSKKFETLDKVNEDSSLEEIELCLANHKKCLVASGDANFGSNLAKTVILNGVRVSTALLDNYTNGVKLGRMADILDKNNKELDPIIKELMIKYKIGLIDPGYVEPEWRLAMVLAQSAALAIAIDRNPQMFGMQPPTQATTPPPPPPSSPVV